MTINDVKIETLDGVGVKILPRLKKNGIYTLKDLLNVFPNRYISYVLSDINSAKKEDTILVKGVLLNEAITTLSKNKILTTSFSMDTSFKNIKVYIFNRQYLTEKLTFGTTVYVYGKYDPKKKIMMAQDIFFEFKENRIEPIYPDLGIPNYLLKKIIKMAFMKYGLLFKDILPLTIRDKYHLLDIDKAYQYLHFPNTLDDVVKAQRRMKYEEILLFELEMKIFQKQIQSIKREPRKYNIELVKDFISSIPFELTEDQKNATNDIFRDFKKEYPMNRLVQGDVGSGKTVVAAICIYAIYTASFQSALMAPTEVLANQHYESLSSLLKDRIRIGLITSSTSRLKRKEILEGVKDGSINLLIGTQSLFQEDINYNKLGFIIIDEQHRFGVNQRSLLRKKAENPDVLYLTATPIPRTLSISIFGNLDISSIKSMPKGRKIVQTKYVKNENKKEVFEFIRGEISNGHQAYIIAPLVAESEHLDLENVTELYDEVKTYFKDVNISLVHGKQNALLKESEMQKFKDGEAKIMVSTTVIEVGVDVKNATVIAIFDADRFGLSQLHQLRGRVGRNSFNSYCFLISDYENIKRLKIMEEVNDGFILSEEDLKMRGPGDYFGTKQSGIPSFRFIDFTKDINIITTARDDAIEILSDGLLKNNDYSYILEYLKSRKSIKDGVLD